MKNTTTLGTSILNMRSRSSQHIAVKFKKDHSWITKNWAEYYEDIEQFGCGLLHLGIKEGDRIAIMSNTRYEWSVADYGIFGIKAITIPVYQNNTPEDVKYILNNSEARILICEGRGPLKIFESVKEHCTFIEHVVVMDPSGDHADILSWTEFMRNGAAYQKKHPQVFRQSCETITSDDIATILYTSGTTGLPKGVVLTHLQAISQVSESFTLCGATEKDISLSFLPYAHILGRIEHWGHLYIGFMMAYAENLEKMRHNLSEIAPTFLFSVPRIFEKIYAAVWAQVHINPIKNKVFKWAVDIGKKAGKYKMSGEVMPLDLLLQYQLAQKLALNKVTQAFGGRLRFAISGGAPLSQEIALFFQAANILILEGYGLTETTAAITVNTPFNYHFGTVGRPIGEVQLKIANDGEILVKSDKVMREYYKNPEATKEAFTDGWFHTGDIGEILPGGELKITDRKKDLIKTAGGKYVAPQRLEGLLKNSPYISHVHIHGDQKKYVVALITLDRPTVEKLAKNENIPYQDWPSLIQSRFIQDLVHKIITETNSELGSFESIKKFKVLPNEFTVEGGELTPSLKVKRKVIDQRFKQVIDELYL